MTEPIFVPVERMYRDNHGTIQAQIANRWAAFTNQELHTLRTSVSVAIIHQGHDQPMNQVVRDLVTNDLLNELITAIGDREPEDADGS